MSGHGRVYRTDDGRHVPEGHPDAAFLAYLPEDKLPKAVADELEDKPKKAAAKKRAAPADKKAGAPADK